MQILNDSSLILSDSHTLLIYNILFDVLSGTLHKLKTNIMTRNLLLVVLFVALGASAQETHHINWFMGVSNAQASMTINLG